MSGDSELSAGDDEALEDEGELDPLDPHRWYSEPAVCGSCIAWKAETRPGDTVATGACRLRPEIGRVPGSLKLCSLYKPRGEFVYRPSPGPNTRRKRASAPKVLRRAQDGELVQAMPPPRYREPPPSDYVPPRTVDIGTDSPPMLRAALEELLQEELGRSRVEMQDKYKRGGAVEVVAKDGAKNRLPAYRFFSMVERLKLSLDLLEQKLEQQPGLDDQKDDLVKSVRSIRGSFTTLNVLFADREDYFTGKE